MSTKVKGSKPHCNPHLDPNVPTKPKGFRRVVQPQPDLEPLLEPEQTEEPPRPTLLARLFGSA